MRVFISQKECWEHPGPVASPSQDTDRRDEHTHVYSKRQFGVFSPLDIGRKPGHPKVNLNEHGVITKYRSAFCQVIVLTVDAAQISQLELVIE